MHADKKSLLSFLSACLRGDRSAAASICSSPEWSWDSLVPLAASEAVLPCLFGWLSDLGLVPESHGQFFSDVASANRERNAFIFTELRSAVGLLNGAGITPVLLKGSALLTCGVYADPGQRYLMDLDLLVSDEEAERASALLLSHGFVEEDRDAWGRFRHHCPPVRRPGSVDFEIHHRMGLDRVERVLSAREVIAESRAIEMDGLRVRVPCPEHLLVHLIVHSQLQGAYNERIWPSLRAFCDLEMLQRRFGEELRWDRVVARFRAAGCERLLVLHLMRAGAIRVAVRVDWVTRLLWWRRETIRRRPWLRYVDAGYMYATVLGRRFALLRGLLGTREGIRHVAGQLGAPGNYARLWADLTEGRGR